MLRIKTYDDEVLMSQYNYSVVPRKGDTIDNNGTLYIVDRVIFFNPTAEPMATNGSVDVMVVPEET